MNFLKSNKLVIIVLLLLGLNVFSLLSLPFKLDLSANHSFTLSPASTKVIGSLDDIVTIKVFSSSNLPPRLLLLHQNLQDLLQEYRWLSHGKINVNWLTPDKDKDSADEAQRLGIPELQFQSIESDKYQVTAGYFGLAILFEDKKEIIPVLEDNANLEYQLTSSIRKIARKEVPTVGLVSGHGELWENQQASPYSQPAIEQVLAKEFLLENLTLASGSATPIPESFSALIVAGPKAAYDDFSRFSLDQFIMQGKPILFFLDGVDVSNNLEATPAKHNLFELLKSYGLTLKTDLVLDQSAATANFNSGTSTFFIPYPYWVKVLPEGINQQNPATLGLQGVVLPWVSSIDFPKNDKHYVGLINSSSQSWIVNQDYNLNPTQKWLPIDTQVRTLAVLFNGKTVSAFKDKAVAEAKDKFLDHTDAAKILLVGDSEMISENIASGFQPNLQFLLNILEYMTSSENLAQIQVKQQDIRPLNIKADSQTEFIKYASIIGVPLFVGLLGFIYLFWRSKQKFAL